MKGLLAIFLILSSIIIFSHRNEKIKQREIQVERERVDSIAAAAEKARLDSIEQVRVEDSLAKLPKRFDTQLKAGEGVFQVLSRMGLSDPKVMEIINALRFDVELVNLVAGERFSLLFTPDTSTFLELRYSPDRATTHILTYDTTTQKYSYNFEESETEVRYRMIRGDIKSGSTLNQELIYSGIPNNLRGAATNILANKVSFRRDARVGDIFTILLREELLQDTLIPSRTEIMYIAYEGTRAGNHEAFRFYDGDRKSTFTSHYTEEGQALSISGLRYPLDRLHVSSPFGMRRHPITGVRSMHNGIDYAAPTGTPVYAVAEGVVVRSNFCQFGGNTIAVRHSDNYISYYLHLHRRSVSVGQRVQMRQVIGIVGNTGRSTGPHLHFGFKNPQGRWINPTSKRMIATPKLSGERLENFKEQVALIKEVKAETKKVNGVEWVKKPEPMEESASVEKSEDISS